MKRVVMAAMALAAVACDSIHDPASVDPTTLHQSAAPRPAGPPATPPPASRIVVLQPRVDPAAVARDHGISPTFTYTHVLNGFAGSVSDAARAGLLRDNRIVSIEPDRSFGADSVETAPSWGLDRIDQRKGTDGFYSYSATGRGVTAYVIDTGIRFSHVDFEGRAAAGFDAFGGDASDCDGHGTHVAGTLGGSRFGVAKQVSLVSVRVLDCVGSGTTSTVLAGLEWVLANAHRPAVANMSLSGDPDSLVDGAVRRLVAAGIPVVVAAGNNGADACGYSPGRTPDALTIGASNINDDRVTYSNFGDCVDWFAPGSLITSDAVDSDSATAVMSGTSMAAPHVAGAAAIYLQLHPGASSADVAAALESWTTKHVVHFSSSHNNDLLYTLGDTTSATGGGNNPPTAAFSASCAGLTCSFADGSSDPDGTVTAWSWDFGDGSTSTQSSPAHAYAVAGSYVVSLTVTDNAGASTSTSQTLPVSTPQPVDQPPVPDFTISCARLACTFTDASTDPDGQIVQTAWDFGDGASSISAASSSPSHTFTSGATYPVTLTVTDDKGTSASLVQSVPVGVRLTATGYRLKGRQTVDFSWVGVETTAVDLYSGSTLIATVPAAAGTYTYVSSDHGQGSSTFHACEAGSTYCSAPVSVTF